MKIEKNIFWLHSENFDFFEEFWIKLDYKKSDFFEWNKKYKLEKKEANLNNKEKYILYVEEKILEIELTEIMFSLEKELWFKKYNILDDFIENIKIKLYILLKYKNINIENIEESFTKKWISKETMNTIKKYDFNKSLFKYRKIIKDINKNTNENIEENPVIIDELYKTFYNIIFHIWIEYMWNNTKVFTQKDFRKIVEDYNIILPKNQNLPFIYKEDLGKTQLYFTVKQENFLQEKEELIKKLLNLPYLKKQILKLKEENKFTSENIYKINEYLNRYIYEFTSIYNDVNWVREDFENDNLIDIVEKKQFMCLTKNMLLYWIYSEIPELEMKSNFEPHHTTSTIYSRDNKGKTIQSYLEPSIYKWPKDITKSDWKNWIFNEYLITTKKWNFIKKSYLIEWESKNILYSWYLWNIMYKISEKENFSDKNLDILEELFKYSTMSEKNNYIAYRSLWKWYEKLWKKEEAIKKYKETIEIYPLDTPAWIYLLKYEKDFTVIKLINILIRHYNEWKLFIRKNNKNNTFYNFLDKLYEIEFYKKYNLSKTEFDELILLFKNKDFWKLLEYF